MDVFNVDEFFVKERRRCKIYENFLLKFVNWNIFKLIYWPPLGIAFALAFIASLFPALKIQSFDASSPSVRLISVIYSVSCLFFYFAKPETMSAKGVDEYRNRLSIQIGSNVSSESKAQLIQEHLQLMDCTRPLLRLLLALGGVLCLVLAINYVAVSFF